MAELNIVERFTSVISDLRSLSSFRTDDRSDVAKTVKELCGIMKTVKEMEGALSEVEELVEGENAELATTKDLLLDLENCQRKLEHMVENVPERLPALPPAAPNSPSAGVEFASSERGVLANSTNTREETDSGHRNQGKDHFIPSDKRDAQKLPKPNKATVKAPRHYVCVSEFNSVASYMKGRIKLDQVNMAIDEIAEIADEIAKKMKLPRRKLADVDSERVLGLRDVIADESVAGRPFFLETDLKRCSALPPNNSGKQMLAILRHLGRLSETRVKKHRVYIILN